MRESIVWALAFFTGVALFFGGFYLAGTHNNSWWLMLSLWSVPTGGMIYVLGVRNENQ